MREYNVYLMNEEVAREYFGQESKLFQLFLEEMRCNEKNKEIVQKQISYITQPIPALRLQKIFAQNLKNNLAYQSHEHSHYVNIAQGGQAELAIFPSKLTLKVSGGFDTETVFFEMFRKLSPCFFAVDIHHYRYGWVNPIKQLKLI